MGLVGASGSFEVGPAGGYFPNVHVRTNAFMMRTPLARRTLGAVHDQDQARCVPRRARVQQPDPAGHVACGLTVAIVGANGRAYAPEWWRGSRTFHQGDQANLLVADNQTRDWDAMTWPKRELLYDATWGALRTPGPSV